MALNIKLVLDKRRAKADGTYPLVMRIIYNRKSTNIPLGHYLLEEDWDEQKERIKRSTKVVDNISRFNKILEKKRIHAYDIINKLEDEGLIVNMSITDIKNTIIDKPKLDRKITVFQFIEKMIEEKREARKDGMARIYKDLLNKLKKTTNGKDLKFENINYAFLTDMEKQHLARGSGYGSLSVYLRTLRALYNVAIKLSYVDKKHYPFREYKIKNSDPARKALSEDVFNKFREIDLPKDSHLYRTKQLFLASFYMRGMNWMDMAYLRVSNIQGNFERINYIRRKTGKPFSIKISPQLKEILLGFLPPKYNQDSFIFPILSNQPDETKYNDTITNKRKRLNKYLKKITEMYHIPSFTIYSARHTWATLGKLKGVPTAILQESLGHKTEAITQTYLDSFSNEVLDEWDKVIFG